MDNRTKERKPSDKGRVKMKPPDGLKAMPKELAVGAIQDGTQRIMSQLRDAGQREERSDYGGERIESAATDGARLAARSVEAFLKSGAAALSRSKGEEPPPDDLPFDETAPQETAPGTEAASVAEELPATEYPPLPEHAENPAFPEHPVSPEAAGTEPAFVSEQPPSAGQPPLPEHSDFPETVTPTETPVAEESQAESRSKRRSRRDEEPVQTERSEESWRPAYQDATPTAPVRPVTVIVKKSGGAAREDPGRVPRGREGGALRARNAGHTMKTLADNDAPPLLTGQGVREAAALPPPAGQPAAEYGRRKLIQERGQELAAKRTDTPLLEGNAPHEPLQLPASGVEYQTPQMPEPPVMRTGETGSNLSGAIPEQTDIGDSHIAVKTKEPPLLTGQQNADRELVKERELLPSAPRSGGASAGGNSSSAAPNGVTSKTESAPKAPQTGRVGVKTREASGYPTASSGADTATKTAVQGKQKAVRERAEQVAERQNAASVRQGSVSVSPETSVPPPKQSAVPVKTKAAYAKNETPSAEPESQSAAQGKDKLVRERMNTGIGERNPAASADTPTPISERNVTVKIKEAPFSQEPTSQNGVAPGQRKAIRERANQVAERQGDTKIREPNPAASADTSLPISERSVTVKTKATGVPQDATPPIGVTQGQRKAVRERAEQVTGQRIDTVAAERNSAASADTPTPISERNVTVKTKEAPVSQEPTSPSGVAPGQRKAIRERMKQVAGQRVDTVTAERNPAAGADTPAPISDASVKLSASRPEQSPVPVKTKAAVQRNEPFSISQEPPRVKEKATSEQFEAVPVQRDSALETPAPIRERPPVKTREPSFGQNTPSAEMRSVAAGRQKALQDSAGRIAERRTESGVSGQECAAATDTPKQNAAPVKTKEAYAQRETPPAETRDVEPGQQEAVKEQTARIAHSARPEVLETPLTPVKTREAHGMTATDTVQKERMPVKTKEAYAQTGSASQFTEPESAALRPDASPRINGEKPSVKTKTTTAPHVAETPPPFDKAELSRQQAAVKTREALTQSAEQAPQAPDIPDATGNAYGRRDVPLPKERTNYGNNSEQRPPSGEQSRAADSKPSLKKTLSDNNAVKKAMEEAKPAAIPADEGVKTKGAWLRQQGKDRPKERGATEALKGKPRTKGGLPVKLANGLPSPKTADSFPLALPPWEPSVSTGGAITGTPTARFVREKGGTAAGKVVRDLVPSGEKGLQIMRPTAIKEAGTTGAKAVKTAERSTKTVKTAEAMSLRIARNAAQTARSVQMGRAAIVAQRGAKAAASTLRETGRKAVSTVKSAITAAQSLASALAAGGSTALVIVIVICLVAALIAAPFGLFLSGQTGAGENLQSAMSELVGEYGARIEQIKEETDYDELDIADDIMSAMMSNRKNVLAVYAVRVTTKDADATEVVTLTDEKKEILRETFFDMNRISYHTTSRTVYSGDDDDEGTTIVTLHISVSTKNAEEMADEYHFNARQRQLLQEMLSPEYDELFESLLGGVGAGGGDSPVLDPEILDGITLLMPSDLSEQRRQVVLTGAQLLGRVHYFWGGKSRVLGWDSRWGTPTRVWAAGSPSTGTVRPFGLDCSGFVDWVFYNVSGGTYLIGHGGGASSQHTYCTPISWSEALPGDLVFYPGDRHVGIVVGHDTFGNIKIMHCASGSNNVVITGKIGFVSIGRPRFFSQ